MTWTSRAAISALFVLAIAPPAIAQLQAELYASGFNSPIAFVQDPSREDVQMVVEQGSDAAGHLLTMAIRALD